MGIWEYGIVHRVQRYEAEIFSHMLMMLSLTRKYLTFLYHQIKASYLSRNIVYMITET